MRHEIASQGKLANRGTYDQLQAEGTDFASLLKKREEESGEKDVETSSTGIMHLLIRVVLY